MLHVHVHGTLEHAPRACTPTCLRPCLQLTRVRRGGSTRLQSQRAALDAAAAELAHVRRAAAVERQRPELEGPWLQPPAPAEPADADAERQRQSEAAARLARREAVEGWRNEWLNAMAHSI